MSSTRRATRPEALNSPRDYGLHRAIVDARQALGVRASLIIASAPSRRGRCGETLDAALAFKDRLSALVRISSEQGHPPSKFKRVINRARDAGFFLSAHAGEEGPPSYIWEALDELGCRTNRSRYSLDGRSGSWLQGLAREKNGVDGVPLSNLRLAGGRRPGKAFRCAGCWTRD